MHGGHPKEEEKEQNVCSGEEIHSDSPLFIFLHVINKELLLHVLWNALGGERARVSQVRPAVAQLLL